MFVAHTSQNVLLRFACGDRLDLKPSGGLFRDLESAEFYEIERHWSRHGFIVRLIVSVPVFVVGYVEAEFPARDAMQLRGSEWRDEIAPCIDRGSADFQRARESRLVVAEVGQGVSCPHDAEGTP